MWQRERVRWRPARAVNLVFSLPKQYVVVELFWLWRQLGTQSGRVEKPRCMRHNARLPARAPYRSRCGVCAGLLTARMHLSMVACAGPLATIHCELRQARKGATAAVNSGAGVWLVQVATLFSSAGGPFSLSETTSGGQTPSFSDPASVY